jgi:antitoxin component of MazEF toxin-antitoxin module
MPIVKNFCRVGNSTALVIDKVLLEALDLTPDAPVQIEVDGAGKRLIISPAQVAKGARPHVTAAYKKTKKRYDNVFKRLAE